jgi:quercetin dioxygenase-like cupin family protein
MIGRTSLYLALAAGLFASMSAPVARADDPPKVQRNIVLKEDIAVADHEGVMAKVDIPPGATEGKHTHPADAFIFVLEGVVQQEIDGKPTVTLKAGDVVHIPANTVHCATNKSTAPVKFAVVFVAEKGKPLTTPVK